MGKCEYCGKEVRVLKIEGMTNGIPEPCDCEGHQKVQKEREAREAREQARTERMEANRRLRERFRECMLPADLDLSGYTFAAYTPKNEAQKVMLDRAKAYAAAPNCRGLFFMGTPGTGKTHLALAIQAALRDDMVSLFTTPGKLFDRLQMCYKGGGSLPDLMNALARVPLLILDDIDKFSAIPDEFGGSWSHQRLFEIINDRSIRKRPIIVTSNLSAAELETKLTPAIFSRLRGMTDGVGGAGPDHRRTK